MATLNTLFQKVRVNYLIELKKEIEKYNRAFESTDVEKLIEKPSNKSIPSAYKLHRVDMVSNSKNHTDFSEFQTKNAIYFKPREVKLLNNTRLRVEPFLWEQVDIECSGVDYSDKTLVRWLYKWMTEKGTQEVCPFKLKGCVHGATITQNQSQVSRFTVDMGSAKEQALLELIHALDKSSAEHIRIYSRSLYM